MAERNLGRLQGTPWHVGYVTKKENDPKRHRSRCTHYRTDGSCRFHSHCIGSAHCMDYEDALLTKQKKEYKANRKAWQELAPNIKSETIVQLDDFIEIYSYSDKQTHVLDFHKDLDKLPPLHRECLGRQIGSIFEFRGEKYKLLYKRELAKKKRGNSISHVDKITVKPNDTIEVFSFSDKEYYPFLLDKDPDLLPPFYKECLGRKVGDQFEFRGEQFKIIRKIRRK